MVSEACSSPLGFKNPSAFNPSEKHSLAPVHAEVPLGSLFGGLSGTEVGQRPFALLWI